MNKENLPTLKPSHIPSDSLSGYHGDLFLKTTREVPNTKKEVQNLSRNRSNVLLSRRNCPEPFLDLQQPNKLVISSIEMPSRQSLGSEKVGGAQKLPQSATSNRPKRLIKVRRSSGSSGINIEADCSNGIQATFSVNSLQYHKEEEQGISAGNSIGQEGSKEVYNSTASFGYCTFDKDFNIADEVVKPKNDKGEYIKELDTVQKNEEKKEIKENIPGEVSFDQKNSSNTRYMEFTLSSGFGLEESAKKKKLVRSQTSGSNKRNQANEKPFNNTKGAENLNRQEKESEERSFSSTAYGSVRVQKQTEQKRNQNNRQKLVLDLVKARSEEKKQLGMQMSRNEGTKGEPEKRNPLPQRQPSREVRESQQGNRLSQTGTTGGKRSNEASSERLRGEGRTKESDVNTVSQRYGKSPRSKFLVNLSHVRKLRADELEDNNEDRVVKELVEENSNLKKANDQKEELIGILISTYLTIRNSNSSLDALKQKENGTNQLDLPLVSTLPNIEPFSSPKDTVPRQSFNRSKVTSADKPFLSGTPVRCSNRKPPSGFGPQEMLSGERGKSNEPAKFYDSIAIPPSLKPFHPPMGLENLHHSQSSILNTKRVYSSPLPLKQQGFDQERSAQAFLPFPVASHKSNVIKNDMFHSHFANLRATFAQNGKLVANQFPMHESKSEYESAPKPITGDLDYGLQRRGSRDSDHTIKSYITERHLAQSNGGGYSAPNTQKSRESVQLSSTFNTMGLIGGTFNNKIFRTKSPVRNDNDRYPYQNMTQRIVGKEEYKYQSASGMESEIVGTNREKQYESSTSLSGLREVKSYGNLQKEIGFKETIRFRQNDKNNENRVYSVNEKEERGPGDMDAGKPGSGTGKKEKFPKEVFTMNLKRKFFC